MSKLSLTIRVSMCVVALVGGLVPGGPRAAAARPHPSPRSQASLVPPVLQALEWIRRLPGQAPVVRRVEAALARATADRQEQVITDRFVFATPVPDVSGDGIRDVVATDFRFELSFGGGSLLEPEFEFNSKAEFVVLSGHKGRKLWSVTRKARGFVGMFPVKVGRNGAQGFMLWDYAGPGGPLSEYDLTMISLRGRDGKRLWRERHTARQADLQEGFAYHDVPLIFGSSNALKGTAHDFLLGIGTVVGTYYGATVADVTAHVIDGRTGESTAHPAHEVAVNWFPLPWTMPDLDGDGLDDYAFTNNHGVAQTGGEPGDPPIEIGGVIKARKGTDGSELWTTGGFEFGDFAWLYEGANMIGAPPREILVTTPISNDLGFFGNGRGWRLYLVDGGGEGIVWKKTGGWPSVLGDIDRDGVADVLSSNPFHRAGYISMRFFAYSASGKKIYEKVVRKEFRPAPAGYGIGWGWRGIGDIDLDGVEDLGVNVSAGDNVQEVYDHYVFDARRGEVSFRGGKELNFLSASLDARGTDLAELRWRSGNIALEAIDGRSGSLLLDLVIDFGLPFEPTASDFFSLGAEVSGDDCDDLVGSVSAKRGGFVFVLDGGSGETLWSYTLFGPEADARSTVAEDANPVC